MALTPEQILNKHFQTTQFRKGYDERDVDDFLDDVVAEMRAVTAQRDDFKHQFEECRSRQGSSAQGAAAFDSEGSSKLLREHESKLADLKSRIADAETQEGEVGKRLAAAQAEVAEAEAHLKDRQGAIDASVQERLDAAEGRVRQESEAKVAAERRAADLEQELGQVKGSSGEVQGRLQQAEQRVEEAQQRAAAAEQRAQEAEQRAAQDAEQRAAQDADKGTDQGHGSDSGALRAVAGGAVGGTSAAALIELAQRLHDEHVGKGEARRDELINEGQAHHDELLSSAQSQHDELLGTAQTRHDELLGTAQEQHDTLIAQATERHEQLITEGRERSTGMVAEAQQKKAAILTELEQEKGLLEQKIDQLRGFERSYRSQLKSYLQSQLAELDHEGMEPSGDAEASDDDGPAARAGDVNGQLAQPERH